MTRRDFLLTPAVAVAIPGAASHDVRRHGARGDGVAKDTKAIQAALDAAAKQGGGTVMLTAGRYLSGTLHLRSNVTLELQAGALLMASPDAADFDAYEQFPYPTPDDRETTDFRYALLQGEQVERVAIIGEGTIDGNRTRRGGPKPVALRLCKFVTIRGVTIRRAPNYAISLIGTDYVNIDGVSILDAWADGIDPDSCRYVRISNVVFDGWDDAIVAKASHALGYRRSTENLTVTNCVLTTNSCYLKFGSESGGDFKNVTFSNCALYRRRNGDPRNLAAVSLETTDGGTVDGVAISNITADEVYMPFALKIGTRGRGGPTGPGSIRNVTIANFVARRASVAARITGLAGHPVENVNLSDVSVSFRKPGETAEELKQFPGTTFLPQAAFGLVIRHANRVALTGVRMRSEVPDQRPAMVAEEVGGLTVDGVEWKQR